GAAAVDPDRLEAAVEELAGAADKGMPGEILAVARLFADKHHRRPLGALAKDGLRRVFVERASLAFGRRRAQLVEAPFVGDERARAARADDVVTIGHHLE